MPEALLIWIVLTSFLLGLVCGLVIAYIRGLMRRKMFTFSPVNRHIRILRRGRKHGPKRVLLQNIGEAKDENESESLHK